MRCPKLRCGCYRILERFTALPVGFATLLHVRGYHYPVATHGLQDLAHERRFRTPARVLPLPPSESEEIGRFLQSVSSVPREIVSTLMGDRNSLSKWQIHCDSSVSR